MTTVRARQQDWEMMTTDQAVGRLLIVPTKVVYSECNLGKQFTNL